MTAPIKPCPFCGSPAQEMKGVKEGFGPFYSCSNDECGIWGRYSTAAQWENRQPDAELVALLSRAVESRIDDKWIKDVREVLKKRTT